MKSHPEGGIPNGETWWVDLQDPTPEEEELVFKQFLPVHPLTLEDINRSRRLEDGLPHLPKVEEFDNYLFVIVDALRPSLVKEPTTPPPSLTVQLSAILTRDLLITHHYDLLPAVEDTRRFIERHCNMAERGPDYLFHLVLDGIVDDFAPAMDRMTDRLEELESEIFDNPTPDNLNELLHLKRRVISFRKILILEREVLARLIRGEFELVEEREIVYYRNVYDHLVRYTELTESAREMVSDLMQTHLAATSNKLNGVMKFLAMISTVILPMSLIAGIYGMNFKKMPELEWDWGYPFSLGLMLLVGISSILLFRWKKWI